MDELEEQVLALRMEFGTIDYKSQIRAQQAKVHRELKLGGQTNGEP